MLLFCLACCEASVPSSFSHLLSPGVRGGQSPALSNETLKLARSGRGGIGPWRTLCPVYEGLGPASGVPCVTSRTDCPAFPAGLCVRTLWHTHVGTGCVPVTPHLMSSPCLPALAVAGPRHLPSLWLPQRPRRGGRAGGAGEAPGRPAVHSGLPLHGQGQVSEEGVQLCGRLRGRGHHAHGLRLGPRTIVLGTHEGPQQPPRT